MITVGQKYKDRDKRHAGREVVVNKVVPSDSGDADVAICTVLKNGVQQSREVKISRHVLQSRKYEAVQEGA